MNKQREVMYGDRRRVVQGEDLKERIMGMMSQVITEILDVYANETIFPEEWDLRGLAGRLNQTFLFHPLSDLLIWKRRPARSFSTLS